MRIIGVWFDGISGQVRQGDLAASITQKPDIPGLNFDQIVYDPSTGACFLAGAGRQRPLTQEEQALCAAFVERFMASADYPVFAWDALGVYMGQLMRMEAEAKGHAYSVFEPPEHPASKRVDGTWLRIKASITESGILNLDPESVCGNCLIVMSEEEWSAFPQPDPDKPWLTWDFLAEAWVDRRDLAQQRYTLRLDVVASFEHLKVVQFGRAVPQDEYRLWNALEQGAEIEAQGAPVDAALWMEQALEEKKRYEGLAASLLAQQRQWLFCVEAVLDLSGLDSLRSSFEVWFESVNTLPKAA